MNSAGGGKPRLLQSAVQKIASTLCAGKHNARVVLTELLLQDGDATVKLFLLLEYFDGFSIGSNDLTQLTLGLDRDSGIVAHLFDERNPAVKKLLAMAIKACKEKGKYVGICGQGPSDHPDLAKWLMEQGIDSVSLNPDAVLETWFMLAGETIA